jgi:hypothetical protein
MSIETVDTRARAAAAVALVRHRAPETRFLPIAARPVLRPSGVFAGESGRPHRPRATRLDLPGRPDQADRGTRQRRPGPVRLRRGPAARHPRLTICCNKGSEKPSDHDNRHRSTGSRDGVGLRRMRRRRAAGLRPGGDHVGTARRNRGLARRRLHRDQCARLPAMRGHRHDAARSGTRQSFDEIRPVTPRGPGGSVRRSSTKDNPDGPENSFQGEPTRPPLEDGRFWAERPRVGGLLRRGAQSCRKGDVVRPRRPDPARWRHSGSAQRRGPGGLGAAAVAGSGQTGRDVSPPSPRSACRVPPQHAGSGAGEPVAADHWSALGSQRWLRFGSSTPLGGRGHAEP